MIGAGAKKVEPAEPKNSLEYVLFRLIDLAQSYIDANEQGVEDYLQYKSGTPAAAAVPASATAAQQSEQAGFTYAAAKRMLGWINNVAKWRVQESRGKDDPVTKKIKINAFKDLILALRRDMAIESLAARKIAAAQDDAGEDEHEASERKNIPSKGPATVVDEIYRKNASLIQGKVALYKTHVESARGKINACRREDGGTKLKKPGPSIAILETCDDNLDWLAKPDILASFEVVLAHENEPHVLGATALATELTKVETQLLSYLFRVLNDIELDEMLVTKADITGYERIIPRELADLFREQLPRDIASLEHTRVNNEKIGIRINQLQLIVNAMHSVASDACYKHNPSYLYQAASSVLSFFYSETARTRDEPSDTYTFFLQMTQKLDKFRKSIAGLTAENQAARVTAKTERVRGKLNKLATSKLTAAT